MVDQLLEFGEIRRGRLGVEIDEVSPGLAQTYDLEELTGALVRRVFEDSPAEEAGIEVEDVIVSVDGEPVDDTGDLRNRIAFSRIGETVRIGIVRDGERIEKEAVIGEMQPTAVAGEISSEKLDGAEFGEIGRDHPWSGRVQGVEVSSVEPGSRAWESGLRRGDIILAVNREAVRGVEEFAETVEEQEDVLALLVQRGGRRMLVVVR